MTEEELKDVEKFALLVPGLLVQAGLQLQHERELWAWRAHALRRGKVPVSLFLWIMKHRSQAQISEDDEKQAGLDMHQEHGRQLNEAFEERHVAMGSPAPTYRPLTGAEMDAKINAARRYYRQFAADQRGTEQREQFRAAAGEILGRDVRDVPFDALWEELMQKEQAESRRNVTEPPVRSRRHRRALPKRNTASDDFSSLSDVIDKVLPEARELGQQEAPGE